MRGYSFSTGNHPEGMHKSWEVWGSEEGIKWNLPAWQVELIPYKKRKKGPLVLKTP